MRHSVGLKKALRIYRTAIFINMAIIATVTLNVASVTADTGWSPVETRSGPVTFAPEFSGQYSQREHHDRLQMVVRNQMRTRSHQAHPESSPFVSSPKVASVSSDDSQ
jgi:hypothetical protein